MSQNRDESVNAADNRAAKRTAFGRALPQDDLMTSHLGSGGASTIAEAVWTSSLLRCESYDVLGEDGAVVAPVAIGDDTRRRGDRRDNVGGNDIRLVATLDKVLVEFVCLLEEREPEDEAGY